MSEVSDEYVNGIKIRRLPMGIHGSDLKLGNWAKNRTNTGHYGWRSVPAMARFLGISVAPLYQAIREGRIECKLIGKQKYVSSSIKKSDILKGR